MNTSTLFKKAHALTKKIIKAGDNYRVTFGACLKFLRTQTISFADTLLSMGLKVWEKYGKKRIYINSAETFLEFAELANLDKATLNAYSHFVKRISSNKTWFDLESNKFESKKATINTLFEILNLA